MVRMRELTSVGFFQQRQQGVQPQRDILLNPDPTTEDIGQESLLTTSEIEWGCTGGTYNCLIAEMIYIGISSVKYAERNDRSRWGNRADWIIMRKGYVTLRRTRMPLEDQIF